MAAALAEDCALSRAASAAVCAVDAAAAEDVDSVAFVVAVLADVDAAVAKPEAASLSVTSSTHSSDQSV